MVAAQRIVPFGSGLLCSVTRTPTSFNSETTVERVLLDLLTLKQ